MLFLWISIGIVIAATVWLGFWMLVTYLVGKSRRQTDFLAGSTPSEAPSGFYKGSAYLLGNRPVP